MNIFKRTISTTSAVCRKRTLPQHFLSNGNLQLEDKYVKERIYPEVKSEYAQQKNWGDISPELSYKYLELEEIFHSLPTVEERLAILTWSNYFTKFDRLNKEYIKAIKFYDIPFMPKRLRSNRFYEYITKTKIVEKIKLKEKNDLIPLELVQDCKRNIYEKKMRKKFDDLYRPTEYLLEKEIENDQEITKEFVRQFLSIHRILLEKNELENSDIIFDAPVKSWWLRCGYEKRMNSQMMEDERLCEFRYESNALVQIKRNKPSIPKIGSFENKEDKVENFPFLPQTQQVFMKRMQPVIVSGRWYDSKNLNDFTSLSIYSIDNVKELRNRFDGCKKEEIDDVLKCTGILAAYNQLVSEAYYLGFSYLKDLTYPLTTNVILTNGKEWMIVTYQLNTLQLWKDDEALNRCNLAHVSPLMELWNENGEINGSVLNEISSTILNNRHEGDVVDENISLRPYLPVKLPDTPGYKETTLSASHLDGNVRRRELIRNLYETMKLEKMLDNDVNDESVIYDKKMAWIMWQFRDITHQIYPTKWLGKEYLKNRHLNWRRRLKRRDFLGESDANYEDYKRQYY